MSAANMSDHELTPLMKGFVFQAYDEDLANVTDVVKLRLHPSKLFLEWISTKESPPAHLRHGKVLDCCRIRDIRIVERVPLQSQRASEDKSAIQFCCGSDFVNLTSINFACDSSTVHNWVRSLQRVIFDVRLSNLSPLEILEKQYLMLASTASATGEIDLKRLIRFFHGKMSEKTLRKLLIEEQVLSGKGEKLTRPFDRDLFSTLVARIADRPEVEEIFGQLCNEAGVIPVEAFARFLNETQRDDRMNTILFPLLTEEDCLRIMKRFDPGTKGTMRLGAFQSYLMSGENAAVSEEGQVRDLSQPLSHYFINSSHNTYLVGRQFGGKSSVEIYRTVLLSGCRCVELDCWDGVDGDPVITHGMAACTLVLFKDVIRAIADTAFVASQLPVILSFENHCTYKQQRTMVGYCIDIFGDMLLSEPLHNHPLGPGVECPSPADLMGKIIIKNKKLAPGQVNRWSPTQPEAECDSPGLHVPDKKSDDVSEVIKSYKRQHATSTVHPELSAVINYIESVKFAGFAVARERDYHFHVSSFADNTGNGLLKNSSVQFVGYNKRQFSRIYPKGSRFDSSNYFPQLFWNAGCQMVALNFQTAGPWMQLNQGRFEYWGNTGYVLKPLCMRAEDFRFNPFSEASVDGIIAATCSVRVISAQFLSDRKISSFVEVEMFGLPTDTIRKEFRTRTIIANGLSPVYAEEAFVFRKIVLPELAMLKIAVYDASSGKLIGQRHLPFECIQNGYRHVTLRSEANTPLNLPSVLCHFGLSTYIPDEHGDIVDALFDPSRFMSDSERAKKMLNDLGVDDNDIEEDYTSENAETDSELVLPSVGDLRREAEFVLLEKKFLADLDSLKSSFYKRRQTVSKSQCSNFVKELKRYNSDQNHEMVARLNLKQIDKWNGLVREQEAQILARNQEIFRDLSYKLTKLALRSHENFRKCLDKKIKATAAEMLERQAKELADLPKYKNVTKHEKNRRLKEMKDSQLKRFIEERKKAENERMKLEKYWEEQMECQLNEIRSMYDEVRVCSYCSNVRI